MDKDSMWGLWAGMKALETRPSLLCGVGWDGIPLQLPIPSQDLGNRLLAFESPRGSGTSHQIRKLEASVVLCDPFHVLNI